jgi:hypothetical protein
MATPSSPTSWPASSMPRAWWCSATAPPPSHRRWPGGPGRHRAGRRQGPRAVPGNRRRPPCVRRHRGRPRFVASWRAGVELVTSRSLAFIAHCDRRPPGRRRSHGRCRRHRHPCIAGWRCVVHRPQGRTVRWPCARAGGHRRRLRGRAGRARTRHRRAAGRGGRHRARAGGLRRRGAARTQHHGAGDHRQQRQDLGEDPAAVDPAAGGQRLRQSRQPQQRDRPAAGRAGRAGRCATSRCTRWVPASRATSPT